MAKTSVFISWSGPVGRQVAEALGATIFSYPELKPWVSSQDIDSGAAWFEEIRNALKSAKFGVGCLTPGASVRPWVNFEAGYLFGRLQNFKLLCFDEDVAPPLTLLQARDGTRKEELTDVLESMISGSEQDARRWVEAVWHDYEATLARLQAALRADAGNGDAQIAVLARTADSLRQNEAFNENVCLRRVVMDAIQDLAGQLGGMEGSFKVPGGQYPHHLISLQRNQRAVVRAIALVGQHEQFWQGTVGREILQTSQAESERVFVFTTPEDFARNYEVLRSHAAKYKVRAMSFESLTRDFHPYNRDFSIINAEGSTVLAIYDGQGFESTLSFLTHTDRVQEYEIQYRRISRFSTLIERTPEPLEALQRRVFGRPMTSYERRPIEMSAYISIADYDQHEERHAYFEEMMQLMLKIASDERARRGALADIRVLEFGAGTGIFTRRLARLERVEVKAVELDWECFKRLKYNVQKHNLMNVECLAEDSRTFDPSGKFDFVFSSFADHHIKPDDRSLYLENVKRNLQPNGLFIVGDEFLPGYPPNDPLGREEALRRYHQHIIEIAEQQGQTVLVALEREALESGLAEKGDFKVSCEQYESALTDAGFTFRKDKVGPLGRDDLGGVYVYTAWVR